MRHWRALREERGIEPADIDVRDPQYLRHDTRKVVEELATRGVQTLYLTLDPNADDCVARICSAA
jgi:nitric oxide reductase NorD protein